MISLEALLPDLIFTESDARQYLASQGVLAFLDRKSPNAQVRSADDGTSDAHLPDLIDLARLHRLIIATKPLTVIEYGSGYSSLVIASALCLLEKMHSNIASLSFRCANPFHLYSLDNKEKFLNEARRRLAREISNKVSFILSELALHILELRLCTLYSNHPDIIPDFIYIDGPDQFSTEKNFNGHTISGVDKVPLSADLLVYEFQLEPGTIVLIDGRVSNARFLTSMLRRNWRTINGKDNEYTILVLDEPPLGKLNEKKMRFRGLI